jgi:hypothetical protein
MDIFTDDDKKIYESKKLKLSRDMFRFEFSNYVKLTDDVKFCFFTRKKVNLIIEFYFKEKI